MHVRTLRRALATATLIAATAVLAAPAAAAAPQHWSLTLLPLPAGHEGAAGFVNGTDGHGDYAGFINIGDGAQVVTWAGDHPTLRGTPAGTEFASVSDENAAGTIVGGAADYDAGTFSAFLLDDAGFATLPNPDLYRDASPTAINNRGDVIGTASTADGLAVPVLWPAGDLDHPVALETGLLSASAADIDDAGTILLNNDAGGVFLWRDGVLTRLPDPPGHNFTSAGSLSATLVVGTAPSTTLPGSDGFVWCRPDNPTTCESDQPRALPGSAGARYVNESGVIVGRLRSDEVDGPLAVWQGLEYAERLEVPAGQRGSAGALGDDGSIAGFVTPGPLDEGGQPAVWRPAGS